MKLFLIKDSNGKPCAAYPTRVQAEVYASGFSANGVTIIEGEFEEFRITKHASDVADCEHIFIYPSTGKCQECGKLTEPPRV